MEKLTPEQRVERILREHGFEHKKLVTGEVYCVSFEGTELADACKDVVEILTAHTEPEDEWEDGDPIHPGPYWLWADFNSFEGDQDGKDLTIGQWNGEKWVTRSDGIPMYWIKVIKWKPYEEIWPSPPLQQEDK